MASPSTYHQRARVASLSRSRAADDPDLLAARRALKAEGLADSIRLTASDLSREQRLRLASMLTGGGADVDVA